MIGIGLYRRRRTPLHLLPAWIKIVALAAFAITAFRLDGVAPALTGTAVALVLLISTLPPLTPTVKGGGFLVLMAGFAGTYHWLFGDPQRGTEIALTLASIAIAALALNSSTSMQDALDVFASLARPLRRWVPTEALGLMASIMLRSIPETARILTQTREAARARGVSRKPRAVIMPTTLRVVNYALATGDAITARGLAEADA